VGTRADADDGRFFPCLDLLDVFRLRPRDTGDMRSAYLPRAIRPRRPSDPPCRVAQRNGAPDEVAARADSSDRVLHDAYLHCIGSQEDLVSQQIEDALKQDSNPGSSQCVKADGPAGLECGC